MYIGEEMKSCSNELNNPRFKSNLDPLGHNTTNFRGCQLFQLEVVQEVDLIN